MNTRTYDMFACADLLVECIKKYKEDISPSLAAWFIHDLLPDVTSDEIEAIYETALKYYENSLAERKYQPTSWSCFS